MYDKDRTKKKQEMIEREQWKGFSVRDFMALKDLMDLLDENDTAIGGSAEGGPRVSSTGGLPSGTVPNRQS